MNEGMITYKKKKPVAIITLNRPNSQNSINTKLAGELKDIRDIIIADDDIKVVILTGEGRKTFCAGIDVRELSKFHNRRELTKELSVSSIIDKLEKPVIAAINGYTSGQGLELALACDIRISANNAKFSMNNLTSKNMPWDGGTQRLPRIIGKAKAIELILTGDIIDSQTAFGIGLVNKIVSINDLMQASLDTALGIATKSTLAVRYAKEAISKGMDLTLEQGLHLEADLYFLLHTTKDRTEGIKAFREKRSPSFKGR